MSCKWSIPVKILSSEMQLVWPPLVILLLYVYHIKSAYVVPELFSPPLPQNNIPSSRFIATVRCKKFHCIYKLNPAKVMLLEKTRFETFFESYSTKLPNIYFHWSRNVLFFWTKTARYINDFPVMTILCKLIPSWNIFSKLSQPSFCILNPVMNLYRTIFAMCEALILTFQPLVPRKLVIFDVPLNISD